MANNMTIMQIEININSHLSGHEIIQVTNIKIPNGNNINGAEILITSDKQEMLDSFKKLYSSNYTIGRISEGSNAELSCKLDSSDNSEEMKISSKEMEMRFCIQGNLSDGLRYL